MRCECDGLQAFGSGWECAPKFLVCNHAIISHCTPIFALAELRLPVASRTTGGGAMNMGCIVLDFLAALRSTERQPSGRRPLPSCEDDRCGRSETLPMRNHCRHIRQDTYQGAPTPAGAPPLHTILEQNSTAHL